MINMIKLLSKIFIKDRDNVSDANVRRAYGILCSLVGVGLNILLFAFKYIAGVVSGSIAITADAFNNLTDAGSSVITLLGFRLAAARPDAEHPFGHGRIEYLSGVAVAVVIIVVGVELARSSIEKILTPTPMDASLLPMVILALSILVKLYMYAYNKSVGKHINSPGMSATAVDSISDVVSTSAVLICVLISRFTSVNLDGWVGAAVALFIIYSGFMAAKDAISPLLGNPPSAELVQSIERIVMSHSEVLNIHDLIVHDYGPGRLIISLHAEVPGSGNVFELHDTIDTIEYELGKELGCTAVIHMDPISTDDNKTSEMRAVVAEAVKDIDPRITIHDFRIVDGPTHTNVIFDAVLPQDLLDSGAEIKTRIEDIVHSNWSTAHPKVHIDRAFL